VFIPNPVGAALVARVFIPNPVGAACRTGVHPEPCRCDFSRTGFFYDPDKSGADAPCSIKIEPTLLVSSLVAIWIQSNDMEK
jgi:hypothetical protein